MKRTRILRALSAILLTLAATAGAAGGSSKLPPAGYDESRDPAADLKAAIAQAQRENKRILLEVGGEWCIYCRILNKVIHDDERLTQRLRDGFVVVKVNFSDLHEGRQVRPGPDPGVPGEMGTEKGRRQLTLGLAVHLLHRDSA